MSIVHVSNNGKSGISDIHQRFGWADSVGITAVVFRDKVHPTVTSPLTQVRGEFCVVGKLWQADTKM
jgi:hypothetical protein